MTGKMRGASSMWQPSGETSDLHRQRAYQREEEQSQVTIIRFNTCLMTDDLLILITAPMLHDSVAQIVITNTSRPVVRDTPTSKTAAG